LIKCEIAYGSKMSIKKTYLHNAILMKSKGDYTNKKEEQFHVLKEVSWSGAVRDSIKTCSFENTLMMTTIIILHKGQNEW
jgi:hypothetical protein